MDDSWMRRNMRMRKWDVMDDMVIMIKGKKKLDMSMDGMIYMINGNGKVMDDDDDVIMMQENG
jgi:hypothetical protein